MEALATAALVQAIREAQEPRTLQVCNYCTIISNVVSELTVNFRDLFVKSNK